MLPFSVDKILQPELTEINRLPARASLKPFPSAEEAKRDQVSPWRQSLDGAWRFLLIKKPDDAPHNWHFGDQANHLWRDIHVPGVWTRQNTGDLPHYANWVMPFDCKYPPDVPTENPTGLYLRNFKLPDHWQDRKTILHIGGFESVALVWCNGTFVGMGKDSRLPSEFDLTAYLTKDDNTLAVMVIRWSDATWIEDQDHWNHAGIHRSVHLESRALTCVADIEACADFDHETGSGHATIKVKVAGLSEGFSVNAKLETEDGEAVAIFPNTIVNQFNANGNHVAQLLESHAFKGYAANLAATIPTVKPWSAEQPTRYRLICELVAPDGHITEAHSLWIGFRRIQVKDRRLIMNGKPIIILGVNRHDHHHENGKSPTFADIKAELVMMKQHNINAVRTAHYPNDHRLLDLCDELGLYVIDEANVECHGRYHEVSDDPRFQKAIIERTIRMVARDRNHPCIIGWSTGNESGHGPAHDAAAAMVRHMDPTRFIHYEGAVGTRFQTAYGGSKEGALQPPSMSERIATDVVCPMYPSIDLIISWARWAEETKQDDRPLIMCEYSHAMGNSNGSITEYIDAFFAEPALGGGFVWDWRDQGLAETNEDGKFYWAYGGHFGEKDHDMHFNCNGLVGPDGTPHPALQEYKWACRPVTAELLNQNEIALTNRRSFADTRDLTLTVSLQKNGATVEKIMLSPVIAAGDVERLNVPFKRAISENAEWHVKLEWALSTNCKWATAGHNVGTDQFALTKSATSSAPNRLPTLITERITEAKFGPTLISFKDDGTIAHVALNEKIVITGDITPCLWRAPTDNDGGKPFSHADMPSKRMHWVACGLHDLQLKNITASHTRNGNNVIVYIERTLIGAGEAILTHHSLWTLSENGAQIDEEIIVPAAWQDLPRIGIRFTAPKELENLAWHGLGPDESYPDRKKAQTIGHWQSTVSAQYHPFVVPQEHGAHEDTRSFQLRDSAGEGFEVSMPKPLSFSARHHFDSNMTDSETLADLVTYEETEVHIDAAMRGLGTGACGPDTLPPYLVGPGTYRFTWELKALPNNQ